MSDPQPNNSDGELDIRHNQPEPSKPIPEPSPPVNQAPVNQPVSVEPQTSGPRPNTPEDWQKIAYGSHEQAQPVQQVSPQLAHPVNEPAPTDEYGSAPRVYTDPVQEAEVEKDVKRSGLASVITKKFILASLGIVLVIVAVFLLINTLGNLNYKTYSFSNDNYRYSLHFPENASSYQTVSHNGYATNTLTSTVVTAYPSSIQNDCGLQYTNLSTAFKINIQGSSYSVCTNEEKAILFSTFRYNGKWQLIEVYSKNSTTPVNTKLAKKVMSSIKVN